MVGQILLGLVVAGTLANVVLLARIQAVISYQFNPSKPGSATARLRRHSDLIHRLESRLAILDATGIFDTPPERLMELAGVMRQAGLILDQRTREDIG